ncbi:hypothetical protein ABE530_04110 [Brucella sp. TWI559]
MVLPVNGARGEVGITIGGADIVIAASMGGLAAVSTELGCKSMHDLYERLTNGEIAAVVSGIRHLTIEGDASSVISALKLKHFSDVSRAFSAALSDHFDGEPGNGQAGGMT